MSWMRVIGKDVGSRKSNPRPAWPLLMGWHPGLSSHGFPVWQPGALVARTLSSPVHHPQAGPARPSSPPLRCLSCFPSALAPPPPATGGRCAAGALTLHSPGPICTGLTGPGARVPRESLEACTLAPTAIRAIRKHAHPRVRTHKMGEEGHSFVLQHLRGHLLLRGHSERPASWKGLGIRQAEGQVALGQSGASLSSAEAGRRGEGLLGQAGPLESREGGRELRLGCPCRTRGETLQEGPPEQGLGLGGCPVHPWTRGEVAGSLPSPGEVKAWCGLERGTRSSLTRRSGGWSAPQPISTPKSFHPIPAPLC